MADTNKVRFGLSNLYFGTYTVGTTGTVTLGSPFAVPGAVSLNLDPDTEETVFWADDVKYYVTNADNGFTGEVEVAAFTDEFKTTFMNYLTLADGGIAQIKGMDNKTCYVMFQSEGDAQKRRGILYNVTLGQISRNYQTLEGTKEPQTATLSITVTGDNATGITRTSYTEAASGYSTLFTNPPAPALPSATTT